MKKTQSTRTAPPSQPLAACFDNSALLAGHLQALAEAFQNEVSGPLGFHPSFVNAKQVLRTLGIELAARKE